MLRTRGQFSGEEAADAATWAMEAVLASARAHARSFPQGLAHYASFERVIGNLRVEDDLAFVMGSERVRPIEKASLAAQTVERRFTHLWRKEGGAWRLVARHANNVPPSR